MEKMPGMRREMKDVESVNHTKSCLWPVKAFFLAIIICFIINVTAIKKCLVRLFKRKKSVHGQVVLITGAGRGLGRAIALRFAKRGVSLACVDINTKNNEETVRMIRSEGGTAESFTCNVANSEQVYQLKKDVLAKFGTVDILINNAALVIGIPLTEMTPTDIRGMYEVNCMGPAFIANAFLQEMIEKNSGHIVNISSVAAWTSMAYLSLYNSTKAGLSRFFESVRTELDTNPGNNIKITNVHSFFINTSADYTSWFDSFLPMMSEGYVAKCVINATLLEKESIAVPSILSLLKPLDGLYGSYQYNILYRIFRSGIKLPSKTEREELPYFSIVSEVSSTIV